MRELAEKELRALSGFDAVRVKATDAQAQSGGVRRFVMPLRHSCRQFGFAGGAEASAGGAVEGGGFGLLKRDSSIGTFNSILFAVILWI